MKTHKRQEGGSYQIPMISWESLFLLVSRVHFNSGKKGKVILFSKLSESEKANRIDITTKIKLRVLMALGPKGGLWWLNPKVTNYLRGRGVYNMFQRMFIRGCYH